MPILQVSQDHGFTLVELLVSTVISAVVILAATSMYMLGTRSYHDIRIKSEADETAQMVLDMISKDIQLAGQHEGEHLFAIERLVVSPAAGVFTPIGGVTNGMLIAVGRILGHVGEHEVRSPFAGVVQSYIAVEGERVTSRQPIAWLRTP